MPVMDIEDHERLAAELDRRWKRLSEVMQRRKLNSSKEGCKSKARGRQCSWMHPEDKCATIGDASDIRMAAKDFETILAELKRLK